jgi:hypothetical protein
LVQVPGAEQLVLSEIQGAMRTAVEQFVFAGTGSDSEPLGLLNTSVIPSVSGSATSTNLLADVQAVLDEGADLRRVSIFASSSDFAALCFPEEVTRSDTPGVASLGPVPMRFTPHLPPGHAITGQFDLLRIAYFEQPEVLVNPFVDDAAGSTRYQVWQGTGSAVAHAQAFVRRLA